MLGNGALILLNTITFKNEYKNCHSVSQDEWFTNKKYQLWITKTKIKYLHGLLSVKKKLIYQQFEILHLIRLHLVKKHTKMSDHKQGLDEIFLEKQKSVLDRV